LRAFSWTTIAFSYTHKMSAILARFEETTNLFRGVLNDVLNPVVAGYDRSIAHNGNGIAVVIDNACLRVRPHCENHKV